MRKPDITKVKDELAARLEKSKAAEEERAKIRDRIAEVRARFRSKETAKKRK